MTQPNGSNWMARNVARVVGPFVRWWVPRRLGGYRQRVDVHVPGRPDRLEQSRSAAVVGGGLAGLTAVRSDGQPISVGKTTSTPLLNMLELADTGLFKFREIYLTPARNYMGAFMEYDIDETPERYDEISFVEFARTAHIPDGLKLALNTFSRSCFAEEDRLSLAELMKSFHFYCMSNDAGLVFDYPREDYQRSIIAPILARLESLMVSIRTGTPVERMERTSDGIQVNGERFDHAVIAADVVGTRAIIERSPGLLLPSAEARIRRLRPGQRYAVLRLWTDRDAQEDVSPFTLVDRRRLLDAVAFYHRIEAEAEDWAKRNDGAVLELHSYAIPDDLSDRAEIRTGLLEEMEHFFPSLKGVTIRFEHLQLEQNFPAFHVGMHAHRPRVEDGGDRLSFAGDWVRLPFPAMLMEAACASGIAAANRALDAEGLQSAPIYSVSPRGILTKRPKRNVLLASGGG